MKPFLTIAFCLFLSFAQLSAQDAKPPESATFISGTVVGEPGSHPLKKVIVQVVAEDQKSGANYSSITDAEGHFRIDSMLPGRYRIFFEKTGFVGVNSRSQRADVNMVTVLAGKSVDDLMFHMLPTAIITGRVTDEDGDPMAGVRVDVLRKVPGKTRRESVNAASTDDQGNFRVAGLFPGQYWIMAMPPPDTRDYERTHDKTLAADNTPETRYLTTYYPGTYDSAQAAPVAVKAGDEMPVNFMLVPARTYCVRGTVAGMPTGERVYVDMVSKLGDSISGSSVASDGTFEVHGAAPGTYTLRTSATAETTVLMASTDVTVTAGDVEGVKLLPLPSFRLSGHLRLEGQPSADLTQYTVNLRPADLPDDPGIFISQDFGENAAVDHHGSFEWKTVNPGSYVIQIFGGNGKDTFFLKSATIGGRSIDAGFTASGSATLDLVLSANAGTVQGVVTGSDAQNSNGQGSGSPGSVQASDVAPISNVSVVAVPEEKYRKIPERFAMGATDQYGRFTVRGLAPGSYTLFAWQDVDEDLFHDLDFLKSQQANGTTVKVEEGVTQKIDLNLSAIGDEWR